MGMTQQTVHFSGRVQGVGFRFMTCHVADRFDVTGYVRNLSDGRVECLVEGEAGQVEAFLDALAESMSGFIHAQMRTEAPHSGQYASFGLWY